MTHLLDYKISQQAPYNIERILYFATRGDGLVVRNVMQELERNGKVTLSPEILAGLKEVITESVSVKDSDIVRAIQLCHSQYKYVICPHTATAVSYFFDEKQR